MTRKPSRIRALTAHAAIVALGGAMLAAADAKVEVEGYAEWRRGRVLVVDGQRVTLAPGAKFKGRADARDFATIPLGYEVKAKGIRLASGMVQARELEAKPNGSAMFEGDLVAAFNEMEDEYRREGRMFEQAAGERQSYGKLLRSGPRFDRVQRIAAGLTPPYLSPSDFRVYVVENDEWNAMAAPNRSIYVFSGLLDNMDDDEVAVVVGHELVHATHEHSRRQFRTNMFVQLAALGVSVAAETIDSTAKRTVLQVATLLGTSAWISGYGRGHEDQADRVGLRYAHEGGYDVHKGPALWNRFAQKYGNPNKVVNFFFGDHSVAEARARNLTHELALNYR